MVVHKALGVFLTLPDDILSNYMSAEEIAAFRNSGTGIYSITVFATKPDCCTPGTGCC